MSKKFEHLDDLILGNQPLEIDLNEASAPSDVDAKSKESETSLVEDTKKNPEKEDNTIDLDELDLIEEKEEKSKDKTSKKEEVVEPETESKEEIKEEVNPEEALKHWSDYFKESSILNDEDLDGFDGSIESLTKAFEKREVRVGLEMVEDYKSQLPKELKYLAENWEEGVPLTDLINIKSNQIKYSAITDDKLDESVETQKMIYTDYLKKTTKFSQSKIEKEVNRLLDLTELKDNAKEALGELKKIEADAEETLRKETKKEQERRKEEDYKIIKSYEKTSKELKEVIPGVKISEKEQKEVFNKVINPVAIDGNGNPVSYIQYVRNEQGPAFDLKLNYLLHITKELTDFSKITNTITTKATKDLSKLIGTPAPKGAKDGISTSEKKGLLDYLKLSQNK